MKSLLLLSILLLLPTSAQAYIYGYTRLYHMDTQTTVDLLYDLHVAEKGLTRDNMRDDPIDELKEKLFPTEQRVQNALEKLHDESNEPITLVWESAPHMNPKKPIYMSYATRFVEERLPKLTFIHADRWRPGCRKDNVYKPPLSSIDRTTLCKVYGQDVDDRFVKKYKNCKTYNGLADLELLLKVLTSSDRKIIVYAGGAHCEAIIDFLIDDAGYEMRFSSVNKCKPHKELAVKKLARLDEIAPSTVKSRLPKVQKITPPHNTMKATNVQGPGKGISANPQQKNIQPNKLQTSSLNSLLLMFVGTYFAYYLWDNYRVSHRSPSTNTIKS